MPAAMTVADIPAGGRFFLMGASHLTALLQASRHPDHAPPLPVFGDRAPAFQPWPVDPMKLPGRWEVASLYVGHTAPFWGPTAVQVRPGGTIGISQGLQGLLRSIAPASQTAALVLSLRGEEFHNLALSAGAHPFEFHLQERADLGFVPGLPVLPAELVEARVAAAVGQTLALLSAVRMFCPQHRIVRLTSPPPAPGDVLEHWLARHERGGHPALAHPAEVRFKLWTLQARMLDQASAAMGVTSLPPPRETLDERGLLRDDCIGDPVHGNIAYGAAVCRQLTAWARTHVSEVDDAPGAAVSIAEEPADASL